MYVSALDCSARDAQSAHGGSILFLGAQHETTAVDMHENASHAAACGLEHAARNVAAGIAGGDREVDAGIDDDRPGQSGLPIPAHLTELLCPNLHAELSLRFCSAVLPVRHDSLTSCHFGMLSCVSMSLSFSAAVASLILDSSNLASSRTRSLTKAMFSSRRRGRHYEHGDSS